MTKTRFGRLTAALLLVAVLALGVAALSACGSSDDTAASSSPSAAAAAGPITVTDDSGVEVTLDKPAEAIVSLAPANTEIAYAIGAGDKMVAGTSYDDYPEEAKALPKIGDFANPNVEKIASYSPDLVLAAGGIQDKLRTKLEDLGMKVYVVDPKTYDGTIATIANVGKLAGADEGAATVTDEMTAAQTEVQAKVGDLEKAKTFLEIYSKPLMTAGTDTFIDDMITIAGGENIGAMAGSGFPNFSTEVLVREDPAVYIADSGSMSEPGDLEQAPRLLRAHRRQGRQGLRHRGQHHRPPRPAPGRGTQGAGRHDPSRGRRSPVTKLARTGTWPGILLAAAILLVCLVLALALGPASLSVGRIWHLLFAGPVKGDLDNAIFWQIRMPRVLTAALVGAALAVAGVILQDLFLNPLTDPVRHRRVVRRRARRHHRHRAAPLQPAVDHRARHRRRARHAGHRLDGGAPARPHRHLRAPARRRDHLVPRQRPRHRADDQGQPGHDGHHLLAHGQLLRQGLARRARRARDHPVHGRAAVLHARDGHPAAGREARARARRGSRAHQTAAARDGGGAHRTRRLGERHHRLRRPRRAARRPPADRPRAPRAAARSRCSPAPR